LVVKDLGSTSANLEGAPLGQTDSPWRLGQTLRIGKNSLAFEYPAAVALAELSRGADDVMAAGDVPPRPRMANDESPAPPQSESVPITSGPQSSQQSLQQRNANEARWSFTDGMVFLFAAAVLVLSIVGFWLLLRN
jgi:hypothetical protein